ncbi:MAG: threonine--tRNA ligase, partial [Clostridia bacterium]|nr:threonine--tRNA ligase [Clostridia bacterium]
MNNQNIQSDLWSLRHTASHVLAEAVLALFPGAKLAIGPATENGFYYDFDVERPFTAEDLAAITEKMREIIKANKPLERKEISKAEALALFKDQPYKTELINDLPEGEIITLYTQGDFTDLCAGPHAESTGAVRAFALLQSAGAYWRGSEKNPMLQRIYGTAFPDKKLLQERLKELAEANKRLPHKLDRALELFTTS